MDRNATVSIPEAQVLWDDPDLVEIPAKVTDEPRSVVIGMIGERVNVDFPAWMVQSLDQEARKLGVTRQSLIKMWLADRLAHQSTS